MMDSVVGVVTALIFDEGAPASLTGSRAGTFDYRSFWGNGLFPYIFRIAAIVLLCAVFIFLYMSGRKNTPKTIMQKYTGKVAVFGDEYENKEK